MALYASLRRMYHDLVPRYLGYLDHQHPLRPELASHPDKGRLAPWHSRHRSTLPSHPAATWDCCLALVSPVRLGGKLIHNLSDVASLYVGSPLHKAQLGTYLIHQFCGEVDCGSRFVGRDRHSGVRRRCGGGAHTQGISLESTLLSKGSGPDLQDAIEICDLRLDNGYSSGTRLLGTTQAVKSMNHEQNCIRQMG
jgi:hypothetical protein